jgi:hypothetical protein
LYQILVLTRSAQAGWPSLLRGPVSPFLT